MLICLDKSVNIQLIIPKYKKIIDKLLKNNKDCTQYTFQIDTYKNNIIRLCISIENIDGLRLDGLDISINIIDLNDILFKVLYYYPEIAIRKIEKTDPFGYF